MMLHVFRIMVFCTSVCTTFIWSWCRCRLKFFGVITATDIISGIMCVFCCFQILCISCANSVYFSTFSLYFCDVSIVWYGDAYKILG